MDAFGEVFDALEAVHLELPHFDYVASVRGSFEVNFGLVALFDAARSDNEQLDAEIEDFDGCFKAKARSGTCQNDDLTSEGRTLRIKGRSVLHLEEAKDGRHDGNWDAKGWKNKSK